MFQRRAYKTYSDVGRNTDNSQNYIHIGTGKTSYPSGTAKFYNFNSICTENLLSGTGPSPHYIPCYSLALRQTGAKNIPLDTH